MVTYSQYFSRQKYHYIYVLAQAVFLKEVVRNQINLFLLPGAFAAIVVIQIFWGSK